MTYIDEDIQETHTNIISKETINTRENQTIQELNLASDFINYKLLHNFYNTSHKDEALYEQARASSFLENKSISQIIKESLSEYLNKNEAQKAQRDLLLEASDEKEVLKILKDDTFSSQAEFAKKYNL